MLRILIFLLIGSNVKSAITHFKKRVKQIGEVGFDVDLNNIDQDNSSGLPITPYSEEDFEKTLRKWTHSLEYPEAHERIMGTTPSPIRDEDPTFWAEGRLMTPGDILSLEEFKVIHSKALTQDIYNSKNLSDGGREDLRRDYFIMLGVPRGRAEEYSTEYTISPTEIHRIMVEEGIPWEDWEIAFSIYDRTHSKPFTKTPCSSEDRAAAF